MKNKRVIIVGEVFAATARVKAKIPVPGMTCNGMVLWTGILKQLLGKEPREDMELALVDLAEYEVEGINSKGD